MNIYIIINKYTYIFLISLYFYFYKKKKKDELFFFNKLIISLYNFTKIFLNIRILRFVIKI